MRDVGRHGYGAANVGNLYRAITDDEAWQILDAAWESGIRYFDTAPHYGLGLSERRLGAFLATKPRDEFTVSTKVGRLLVPDPAGAGRMDDDNDFVVPADLKRVWDFTPDGVRRSLEESLERLGLDSVDIVYAHDPERFDLRRGLDDGLPALAKLRAEGLVEAVGVGSMSTEALRLSAASGVLDLLMVAGRFTLADQSAAETVIAECRANGVRIVAAAVFNSGLHRQALTVGRLAVRLRTGPCRTCSSGCSGSRPSARSTASRCRWPPCSTRCRRPSVVSVVVGGARPEQVRQNALNVEADVPAELWQRLRDEGLVAL